MQDNYLMIDKRILPPYYVKVVEARELIERGEVREVSEAARRVGISRSTYYKYKDFIFKPTQLGYGRKAVLSMMLMHEPGVLSRVLSRLTETQANVLTITQSLPVNDKASVTLSLDVSLCTTGMREIVLILESLHGVEQARLVAVE